MIAPVLMGILNVTPDSFSDGMPGVKASDFIAKAGRLIAEGADILDIGGESTRPGATPVAADEEIRRVLPVLKGIRGTFPHVKISLDTRKIEVLEACAPYGVSVVNDVSFAADGALVSWAVKHGADCVLMHSRGTPETMTRLTDYPAGLLKTVFAECAERIERVLALGLAPEHLIVDPGFGFAKTPTQCLELAGSLEEWRPFLRSQDIGAARLMIGVSRKRFLQLYAGETSPKERDDISARLAVGAIRQAGFDLIRAHNVALTRAALCS